jgi:hypothetical protein
MIPIPNRKELHNMTTTQLYNLNGVCIIIQDKIKAELVLRGDY